VHTLDGRPLPRRARLHRRLTAPPPPSLARRALLWLAAAATLVGAFAGPAGATHTSDHSLPAYGVGALRAEWLADFPLGIEDLGRMGEARVGLYRARFRQDEVNGLVGWSRLDNLARAAAKAGVTLQPVLINMPGEVYTPPKTTIDRRGFGDFATAAVRRYGPNGSFWSTCGCPARPVKVWEIWNEPNIAPYWNVPNAAEYGALLSQTRSALRRADSTARVLFAGLAYPSSTSATRLEPNAFLRDTILAVGASRFDALALHSYKPDAGRAVDTFLAGTVETLKTYGGATSQGIPRHQVWVNEFGRPTDLDDPNTPADERASSEAAQRTWLDTFMARLAPRAASWNLGPVMWYSMRDSHDPSASWLRQGLRRTSADDADAGAKPSWDAYTARSRAAGPLWLPTVR
jgi:polysaccharide biosynthesis protein PslG